MQRELKAMQKLKNELRYNFFRILVWAEHVVTAGDDDRQIERPVKVEAQVLAGVHSSVFPKKLNIPLVRSHKILSTCFRSCVRIGGIQDSILAMHSFL
jgi:hypothetical protein